METARFRGLLKPTAAGPTALVAYDFNGDGKLDLAVGSEGNTFQGNTLCVLLGNGNGTFQPPVQYTVGVEPTTTVRADFNGERERRFGRSSVTAARASASCWAMGMEPFGRCSLIRQRTSDVFHRSWRFYWQRRTGPGHRGPYSPGNVLLGNGDGTFQDYFVLLTNTGSRGTDVEFSIVGGNAKDFGVQQSCNYLGPAGVCTLETSFTPKATGLRTATLQVKDKAGNLLTSVALTGTGE